MVGFQVETPVRTGQGELSIHTRHVHRLTGAAGTERVHIDRLHRRPPVSAQWDRKRKRWSSHRAVGCATPPSSDAISSGRTPTPIGPCPGAGTLKACRGLTYPITTAAAPHPARGAGSRDVTGSCLTNERHVSETVDVVPS
jgi:hypothetical protein